MKTKRFLSAMMVIVMVAVMLPFGAIFASAATYAETTVALVNGTEVAADGLQAAVEAATAGGTITIVKDFTLTGTISINAGTWTIDGANKTITSDATTIGTTYMFKIKDATVNIKDLTLKTMASGVYVNGIANVTIEDCNFYTGGTTEGINAIPAAREDFKGGCSIAINIDVSEDALVTVDGGVYKAYGASGYVICVKGNAVCYDGYFVGENCSFVGRTSHSSASTEMADAISSLSIYGGTWIKPVINRNVLSGSNGTTEGAVLRADKGSVMNIYGGTFANFADVNKYGGANSGTQRDFVLIAGESGNSGFFHIFGGDFYSFMTPQVNSTSSQLIGTFAGAVAEGNKAFAQLNFFVYGGNFYTTVPERENNIQSIVNKTALNINRINKDYYTGATVENQTVTVWGKEFTGVTKYTVTYNQPATAPAGATVKVTHPDGKVYYLSDFSYTGTYEGAPEYKAIAIDQALNGVAKDGSTITLLADISVPKAKIMNRNLKVTIDGNGKKLTCTIVGLRVLSGDVTIKDITITTNGAYALKSGNSATAKVKIVATNTTLKSKSDDTVITVVAGDVKVAGIVNEKNVNILNAACVHEYVDGVDTATHTAAGTMVSTCSKCNSTITVATAAKTDVHEHGNWTKVDDATHSKTCACGDVVTADHAWNDGEITTEPTVEAEGVKTFTCTDCGATKTEAVDKLTAPAGDEGTTPDAGNTDAGDDDATEDKKGCLGSIGFGAVAVVAVAGLACGLVSKKRED